MKPFCVIANPAAGRTRKVPLLSAVRALLDRSGLEHDVKVSQAPGLAITLAAEAAEEGYRNVLAFGGDGTVGEVASGIVGTDTTLGIIPGGTMNLFANEIGIPLRLEKSVEIIAAGNTRRVEVGKVKGRYFLLCAGAGLDAAILRDCRVGLKRRVGKWAYYVQAPIAALRYRFAGIRIIMDDGVTLQGGQVVIANSRHYGNRYNIAPGASPFDGVMDACVFQGRSLWSSLRYWRAIRRGNHLLEEDVEYYKATRFLLLPTRKETVIPFQLDGDYFCDLPVTIEVIPRALPIFVPE